MKSKAITKLLIENNSQNQPIILARVEISSPNASLILMCAIMDIPNFPPS